MIALLALLLQAGHVFQPVDPSWRRIEDTLSLLPNSFVVVKPQERDRKALYWREKRYSEDLQERKILRYDPQGRLRMEADLFEREQFTQILRADGSLSAYHHHRDFRIVDGYSVSPDGKTVHHVQNGAGELVTEGEDGAWQHLRLLPGITVAKDYRGDQCRRISIWIGSDYFSWTPDEEEMSLYASGEHWSVRGQTVDLQITNLEIVDGKVRERKVEPNGDVPSMGFWTSLELQESFRKDWAAVWPKRRAALMDRVDDALNAAEQDWARMGLDSLR